MKSTTEFEPKHALIVVDMQNDFFEGGALPAPDAHKILPRLNTEIKSDNYDLVLYTQDWHPKRSKHFHRWPPHCIRGTGGAELHDSLKYRRLPDGEHSKIIKGFCAEDDGYSGFEGIAHDGSDLEDFLLQWEVAKISVGGLATDWCVGATGLDGLKYGFEVDILIQCIQGIDPDETDKMLSKLHEEGARLLGKLGV